MAIPRALIAMSGGVDSSVAAYLAQQDGFDCIGATMLLHKGGGFASEDVEDARRVANKLEMPFYVFDFSEDFSCHVVDDFVRCYEQGLTPNPCITCNRHLKFDRLLQQALELGCNYVVTGHYAQICTDPQSRRYLLQKAADTTKDQSYFCVCCRKTN